MLYPLSYEGLAATRAHLSGSEVGSSLMFVVGGAAPLWAGPLVGQVSGVRMVCRSRWAEARMARAWSRWVGLGVLTAER